MRPLGHGFFVFSDVGQRQLWSPSCLPEFHRNEATERILRTIPQDQARNSPYNKPGIIKTVHNGFVYYTVAEKIQDASRRAALSAHTIIFKLDELMADGGALIPPESEADYQKLGLPSELHSKGRSISDIQGAIDEYVADANVSTRRLSAGWSTPELNWLIANPRSLILDPAGSFSAEGAIGSFIVGLPPVVSAGLSFAARFIPTKVGFHITAQAGDTLSTPSRSVSVYRSGSFFRDAVESAPKEKVMEAHWEKGFHLALMATGMDSVEVLVAFRDGLRLGKSGGSITADLIARALSSHQPTESVLDVLERNADFVGEFEKLEKEVILNALDAIGRGSKPASEQARRVIGALSPVNTGRQLPKERTIRGETLSHNLASTDTEDVRVALNNAISTIEHDISGDDFETVSNCVRRFTALVIAGEPDMPKGDELMSLVRRLWIEISEWGERGYKSSHSKKEYRDCIIRMFGHREVPSEPSLFDDLIHTLRHAGTGKEIVKTLDNYDDHIGAAIAGHKSFHNFHKFWTS